MRRQGQRERDKVSIGCALDWLASGSSVIVQRLAVAGASLSACLLCTVLAQFGIDTYLFTGVPL